MSANSLFKEKVIFGLESIYRVLTPPIDRICNFLMRGKSDFKPPTIEKDDFVDLNENI